MEPLYHYNDDGELVGIEYPCDLCGGFSCICDDSDNTAGVDASSSLDPL